MGVPPHRALSKLSKQYGPIIHLKLGEVSSIVISSREIAKKVLTVNDLAIADRPESIGMETLWYDYKDLAFSPYNEHWKQMRKICIMEILSNKNVRSYGHIRHDDISKLLERRDNGELVSENILDVLLRKQQSEDLDVPITDDNIKAIIFDMFTAGSETSSTTFNWLMTELMRNPQVTAKAQAEIREAFKGKKTIEESDIQKLKYLKLVIKENLRVHPAVTILPRACREECEVDGYTIPYKAKVAVNIWALGRDPQYWEEPETFKPERFENSSLDFLGNNYEYIPFGAGSRFCPGMNFGLANIEVPLAQLLYHFDWKLPHGMNSDDLDMSEMPGVSVQRKNKLYVIATPYNPPIEG
ncbi:premnaspirodiene oxygenase-like [Olea europaea subsp. europaea]|uniref:Premnaspirodiene oxygenase-like n=1 Tax=Olea europaea subsp. europaea TaxID=158383 RepID=A0A8S0SGE0_OLEEU|nr:premnaspirodiene oxygenase-like [Olea europaea subsp. europaea]